MLFVLVICDFTVLLLLLLLLLCLQNQMGVPATDDILGKLIITPKKN